MVNKMSGQESVGVDVDVAMLLTLGVVLNCRSSDVGVQVPLVKKMIVQLSAEMEGFF